MIHDEDGPEVPVRYVRHTDCLTVDVGPSPGALGVVLCSVTAAAASLDGRAGAKIEFRLER